MTIVNTRNIHNTHVFYIINILYRFLKKIKIHPQSDSELHYFSQIKFYFVLFYSIKLYDYSIAATSIHNLMEQNIS